MACNGRTLLPELRAFLSRCWGFFRRSRLDAERDAELEAHLDLLAQDFERKGLDAEDARLAAMKEFGGLAQVREACREQRGLPRLETLLHDVRFGLRGLARNPAFTVVAVLTLALGIGGNTAVFSAVHDVLVSGLPVREAERLVVVTTRDSEKRERSDFSYPMFADLDDQNTVFSGVFAVAGAQVNLSADGVAEQIKGEVVTGGYFETLGVTPFLGRLITPADDAMPGGDGATSAPAPEPVVVLSHGYWQRRFGGDVGIVGRSVVLNGRPMTIIGVTPPRFSGTNPANNIDVRMPMSLVTVFRPFPPNRMQNRRQLWLNVMARLAPGVSPAQATAALDIVYRRVRAAELPPPSPGTDYERGRALSERIVLRPGARGLGHLQRALGKPLLLLQAVAGIVLLIACSNIANLMLARNAARRHEVAVRVALGAGRGRLLRQWMTESLLLSFAGGAAGLVIAALLHAGIRTMAPAEHAHVLGSAFDPWVLAFTLAASGATGLLTGLAPALQVSRGPAFATLRGEAPASARERLTSLRGGLVLLQVALSVPLLVAAALLAGTLRNLHQLDAGFTRGNVLLASLNPSLNGMPQPRIAALYRELLDGVRALPGVEAASLAASSVLSGDWDQLGVWVEGYEPRQGEKMTPNANLVSTGYFSTMGIPLLAGRDFTEADTAGRPKVAIVNETMARYYFGDESPIGRRFAMEDGVPFDIEIVGVVRDAKYVNLREKTPRHFYLPVWQEPRLFQLALHARTQGDPAALAAGVRDVLRRIDPAVPLHGVTTLETQIETSLARERLVAAFSTAFGALALLLAAIGLYGVLAFSVARRTREIGVRIALGGQRGSIVRLVSRHAAAVVGAGLVLGALISLAAGRVLASLLYDVSPTSARAYLGATLLLAVVAALAAFVPARRAASVDPVTALRCE